MTPWTAVRQASLSMGFSRQEYWSGLAFPSPGDLPNPWIEPRSPALQTGALPSEPPGKLLLPDCVFLFRFQQFDFNMSEWGFLWTFKICNIVSFTKFGKFWRLLFQFFFSPEWIPFYFPSRIPMKQMLDLFILFKFPDCSFLNIFFGPCLFLFTFWDPYNMNTGAFNVVPEVS